MVCELHLSKAERERKLHCSDQGLSALGEAEAANQPGARGSGLGAIWLSLGGPGLGAKIGKPVVLATA